MCKWFAEWLIDVRKLVMLASSAFEAFDAGVPSLVSVFLRLRLWVTCSNSSTFLSHHKVISSSLAEAYIVLRSFLASIHCCVNRPSMNPTWKLGVDANSRKSSISFSLSSAMDSNLEETWCQVSRTKLLLFLGFIKFTLYLYFFGSKDCADMALLYELVGSK